MSALRGFGSEQDDEVVHRLAADPTTSSYAPIYAASRQAVALHSEGTVVRKGWRYGEHTRCATPNASDCRTLDITHGGKWRCNTCGKTWIYDRNHGWRTTFIGEYTTPRRFKVRTTAALRLFVYLAWWAMLFGGLEVAEYGWLGVLTVAVMIATGVVTLAVVAGAVMNRLDERW